MALIETYVTYHNETYKITIEKYAAHTFIYFFHADLIVPFGGQQQFDAAGKWVKKEWNYPADYLDLIRRLEILVNE